MTLQVGKGLNEYLSMLGNLEMTAPDTVGRAIYAGADIVADAIKERIKDLPIDDNPQQGAITGIRTIQKNGLLDGFGIAKKQTDNGYVNVKLGFDGYNKLKSKKYPNGQPNSMIARTFEAGNSFTKKIPFVGPAVRATKAQAEAKMQEIVDMEIRKIVK